MPGTAQDLVSDLHILLQRAHIPGPYVLVAHSFGGIFARLYASTYPEEVVGMVLVDALSESVRSGLTPEQWKLYVNFGSTQPPPGLEKYKEIETLDVDTSLDQMEKAKTARPLRRIPLAVLTQGQPFDLSPWQPLPADFSRSAAECFWRTAIRRTDPVAVGKARGGSISGSIRDRRATQAPAHFHRNPLGRGQLVVFLRCSLDPYHSDMGASLAP